MILQDDAVRRHRPVASRMPMRAFDPYNVVVGAATWILVVELAVAVRHFEWEGKLKLPFPAEVNCWLRNGTFL